MKYNFTEQQKSALNLAKDYFSLDGEFFSIDEEKITKKDLAETLRETINKDMLGGLTLYQAKRRNNVAVMEVIEEIINISLIEKVVECPFVEKFVEIRNLQLGDKNEFYAEGNVLTAKKLAGNHWDIDRQTVELGNSFSIATEWVGMAVYAELEQFLLGTCSLERLLDKVYKAMNKYVKEHLFASFEKAAEVIPAAYNKASNSIADLQSLVDLMLAASESGQLTIAGTRGALRKLTSQLNEVWLADSQKEAMANTGTAGVWEGIDLMVIPQALKSGSVSELALDDTKLFLVAGDNKPIKMVVEGDTRTRTVDSQNSNDMTETYEVATKVGFGVVFSDIFGVFTWSN